MTDADPRCCCRTHGQRLCPIHQPLDLGWAQDVPGALLFLLCLLLLTVNGWGCAGAVAPTRESDPEPFGWCCDGICGLDPWQADTFEQCECSGLVHPVPDTRGECMEAP